jgi:hypothetical protein
MGGDLSKNNYFLLFAAIRFSITLLSSLKMTNAPNNGIEMRTISVIPTDFPLKML